MSKTPFTCPATLAQHVASSVPVHLLKNANALEDVCGRWQERQRYWHGPPHLLDFIARQDIPVTVVRGVRDGTDLEAELRYTRFLNDLRPQTAIAWINCEADLQHLSSSAIRELESISPGSGQRYIPDTAEIYKLAKVASSAT